MKLQEKSLLVFVVLLMVMLLGISVFFSTVLLSSYSALEERYVEKDLSQAVNKLDNELFSMSAIASDWGPWDDTVDFVQGKDPNYIKSNLQQYGFDNLNMNLIIITNTKGEVLFSGSYDLKKKVMVPVPRFFSGHLDPANPLMQMSDPHQGTSGIMMLPEGPILVVSQPIVHSDYSGPPQGVVIMGRYLDNAETARLAELTHPSLTFTRTGDPALSPDLVSRLREKSGTAPGIIQLLNGDRIAGYALIRDIYGKDALVLQITEPRDIYHQGINTTVQVILIILAGGLFLGLLVIFLLDKVVMKRIGSLANQVHSIGQEGSIHHHVNMGGDDELSGLAGEINRMLGTIEQEQQKVLASETRFRDLAEQLPLIIFEMDTAGNLSYVNKAGMDLFGVTQEKIAQGINIRVFLSPDTIEQMQRGLAAV
ncbi:MAG: CHASE4 domain-containing protein, partial [Methanoregula sp.]|nr:CHASE4 domain-containing protein [Methanoregula sp.]